MAALFYSPRLFPTRSSSFLSSAHRRNAYRHPCRLPFILVSRYPRSLLTYHSRRNFASPSSHLRSRSTFICATSADLGDPEESDRLEADHFIDPGFGGAGELSGVYEGDGLQESDILLRDKFEAASQLNESVQSLSTSEIEVADDGGGGGGIKSGGGGGSGGNGGDGEGEPDNRNKKMSTSQVLTLVYATLVGVGGVIGYAKSKSKKSLISGVVSSLVLYHVSTQLPINPVYASSMGLGVSALLLTVMGIRFGKSGKFFPAGLVSIVSLIMTGGYIHGIMRTSNA